MDEPPLTQNPTTSTAEQPVLILISHSHHRPLSRPPDLKFDLRKVSNPPKHIRDAYDGRSKRLREHMMHNEDFTSLLDTAKRSIEDEMTVLISNVEEIDDVAARAHEKCGEDVSTVPDENPVRLVVSCFCERGKHRSVAFAEELSRHKWPRDWAVEMIHRDVDEVNGQKRDQRRKSGANRMRQGNDDFGGFDLE